MSYLYDIYRRLGHPLMGMTEAGENSGILNQHYRVASGLVRLSLDES